MTPSTTPASEELSTSGDARPGINIPREDKEPDHSPVVAAATPTVQEKGSYHEILKSSALIGGSQVANIAIGIVRTKAMAMLLGPAGFGLFGIYGSIQNLTQAIAGLGINSSGVRQIAVAAGTGDKTRIAQTAAVLRRTAIALGLLGAALLLIFSRQVSQLTFGNTKQVAAISLLSIAVFFGLVSGGQGALIQGMRRIGDLAKMNVLGALFGLCAALPLVYFFRQKGVVLAIIVVAGTGILTSWWYSRKVEIQPATVTLSRARQEAFSLLKLGTAFMASGLMTLGVAYAVRTMILRTLGLSATGLYQAAWTLGGLYVGFILQAMGADFYPRLTASIDDHHEANRLVNEQTLVGLLLAGPGVMGTLALAPFVTVALYSAQFGAAASVLRWICLGAMLQVVTWPMGFIVIAKGQQGLFFLCELVWAFVAICLAWVYLRTFGLNGAGIAYFGSYVFHLFLTYLIASRLTGFRWSRESKREGMAFLFLLGLVFVSFYLIPLLWAAGAAVIISIASAIYSSRVLIKLVPSNRLSRPMQSLRMAFDRLAPQGEHTSATLDGSGSTRLGQ